MGQGSHSLSSTSLAAEVDGRRTDPSHWNNKYCEQGRGRGQHPEQVLLMAGISPLSGAQLTQQVPLDVTWSAVSGSETWTFPPFLTEDANRSPCLPFLHVSDEVHDSQVLGLCWPLGRRSLPLQVLVCGRWADVLSNS